jgi:glutathione S-transferase
MMEFLQFRHSPYNEKVRWALDLKGVMHRRRSLLPGPHMATVRKYSTDSTTPLLLRHDTPPLQGSAAILDWLDIAYPAPLLTPTDPTLATQARAIEQRFDDELTPRIRRLVLDTLLADHRYFAAVFGDGLPSWKQRAYAFTLPLAAPLVRKANGITGPESVADGHAAFALALDEVAAASAATGYLVGDTFTRADITAAATLALLVRPTHSPMSAPEPISPLYAKLIARYADHPAAEWTRRIYAKHRIALSDFDGPSNAPEQSA